MVERWLLGEIELCPRKRLWGVVEVGRLVTMLAESDPYLDSFLLWCTSNGYQTVEAPSWKGKAVVILHRECCPWLHSRWAGYESGEREVSSFSAAIARRGDRGGLVE